MSVSSPTPEASADPAPPSLTRHLWRVILKALAALLIILLAGLSAVTIWARCSERPPLLGGVPFSRMILDKNGALLRLGLAEDGIYRIRCALEDMNPETIQATLLYEDRWFYRHPGVNPLSLLRAVLSTYLLGERRMGASTLTMQVARLRYKMHTGTIRGKLQQMLMAFRLEAHYSKREILEAYCNLAPYGSNVEGLEAAARIYFQVPASRLSLPESLALAVTPQNPGKRNPLGNRGDNAALMEARARLAAIWEEQADPGSSVSLPSALLSAPLHVYGPSELPFAAPHASTSLLSRTELPSPVRSTLDRASQATLEHVIANYIERVSAEGVRNAAALLVHWPDMEIRALAGSADFHNPIIQGQVDVTSARRSPGSTLKPFIYALALDQGLIHPLTLLPDTPRTFRGYAPENIDQRFQGPIPASTALFRSRNVPAISLATRLRYPNVYAFLKRAGVQFERDEKHYGLSLVLGGAEVTMRELAGLYGMLPNQGLWRAPSLVATDTRPVPLLSPEAAFITLDMLREPEEIISRRGGLETRLGVYLKTGTSNGYRDAWCAGIFGPYLLVVWIGNCDNTPNPLFVGREVAVPLFREIAIAFAGQSLLQEHVPAAGQGTTVIRLPVCAATGDTDISLCPGQTAETWFIPGVSPVAPTGILRRILVDRESGLRACVETETTEERVWEFWPGDLVRLFRGAGIRKPPVPEWMPGCEGYTESEPILRSGDYAGLRITSPQTGVTHHVRMGSTDTIPLAADAPADSSVLFWFAGGRIVGQSDPGRSLLWEPVPGVSELRVVDDKGRSDSIRIVVEALEASGGQRGPAPLESPLGGVTPPRPPE